jgi:microcystin-dependent protein
VTNINDPLLQGRIKVACPQLWGASATTDWCSPHLPSTLPAVGDQVIIGFEAGDEDHPVWFGVQSVLGMVPVTSVFGRTGDIAARTGDYTPAQVGAMPAGADLSAIATMNPTAAAVPMNGQKLTGLAPGSASTDAATVGQLPSTEPAGVVKMYAGSAAPAGYLICNGTAISRTTYANLFAAIGTAHGAGDGSTTFNIPDLRSRVPVGVGAGSGLTSRALGALGGEEAHVLATAELASHSHSHNHGSHNHTDPGHSHTDSGHAHVDAGHAHADAGHAHTQNIGGPYTNFAPGGGAGVGGESNTSSTGSSNASIQANNANIQSNSAAIQANYAYLQGATPTTDSTVTGSGSAHNNMQPWLGLNFIIKT